MVPPPFFLPPSAFLPSSFHCLSFLTVPRARTPSSGSESTVLPTKMPVTLVTADDWRPSSMMERRLLELESEGLLRRRTSLASLAGHREPQPPEGYVVSFAKFHRHGLGAPPRTFCR